MDTVVNVNSVREVSGKCLTLRGNTAAARCRKSASTSAGDTPGGEVVTPRPALLCSPTEETLDMSFGVAGEAREGGTAGIDERFFFCPRGDGHTTAAAGAAPCGSGTSTGARRRRR